MKYLIDRIVESCYNKLKDIEHTALLNLATSATKSGMSSSQLIAMIDTMRAAEEGFAVAIDNLQKMSEIDEQAEKRIHPILKKAMKIIDL